VTAPPGRARPDGPSGVVRAAGGAVWRRRPDGGLEVVLVHRPRYDDWSLPKGKVDPGETDEQAALREVWEEASIAGVIGPELPSTIYLDRSGKHKRVRYWAMTVGSGDPAGANEVDDARWVGLEVARTMVSYRHDAEVIDTLAAVI
jgi:8-oxo-dGTP pyrophosphatase MutT (NUDIX family)